MGIKIWSAILLMSVAFVAFSNVATADEEEVENVLILDHSNFSEVVSKHNFIVVEFYAPWCGHCKALAPEYEKAASILSSHTPPIVVAKVDANEAKNKGLAEIKGFPTIIIFRNGGKYTQEYKGPRDADGIVDYLIKQLSPASAEIVPLDVDNNVLIVGVFRKFFGEEFENFMTLAEKLRAEYVFRHTLDAKLVPRGEVVSKPTLRLLKPFDELVVDSNDFRVDAMEKFIEEATIPILTIWNSDPSNREYVNKFFKSSGDKAILLVNSHVEHELLYSVYKDEAATYRGKGITFILGDVDVAQKKLKKYGLKEDQTPLLVVETADKKKCFKAKIEPNQIAPWLKDYKDGLLKPFIKSRPVPEVNNESVKVVVRNSLEDVVLSSGKNVLLEFYAPWCGHCKKLAPTLDEVAIFFENYPDVLIAKFDATENDVPSEIFDVKGFPTVYFKSASGNVSRYGGDRTKQDIIDFIQKNRYETVHLSLAKSKSVEAEEPKEEL